MVLVLLILDRRISDLVRYTIELHDTWKMIAVIGWYSLGKTLAKRAEEDWNRSWTMVAEKDWHWWATVYPVSRSLAPVKSISSSYHALSQKYPVGRSNACSVLRFLDQSIFSRTQDHAHDLRWAEKYEWYVSWQVTLDPEIKSDHSASQLNQPAVRVSCVYPWHKYTR